MKTQVIKQLNQINQQFYQTTAQDFSDSRQFYWKGWFKLLPVFKKLFGRKNFNVLDLGCGNGRFFNFLKDNFDHHFAYRGLDSSQKLLVLAAQKNLSTFATKSAPLFNYQDLVENFLQKKPLFGDKKKQYDLIVAFGLLHHLPSFKLRRQLFIEASESLKPNGIFVVAAWQFLRDSNLINRLIKSKDLGIDAACLGNNDYFLDWRRGSRAYRFCHFADKEEIKSLAAGLKFELQDAFLADGKTNDLNHYFVFKKIS